MAVYTRVDDSQLEKFLTAYDVGTAVNFKGIAEGVENSNYFLDTQDNRYILTLYEKRVNISDLPFFLSLMDHFADLGLPSARPIRARDGEILQELCGRTAALIAFVPGLSRNIPSIEDCSTMGAMLARAHKAALSFPMSRENDLSLAGWQKLATRCQRADECKTGLTSTINDEITYLTKHWPDGKNLRSGVIHADFFPDNVLFSNNGEISGLIDFYFSCNDFFVYDLAICLNAWCFDANHTFQSDKANAFIASYQSHTSLTKEEIEILPLMLRGAAIRFLLTRTYDWLNKVEGALVTVKDPTEYYKKLAFHQQNPDAIKL